MDDVYHVYGFSHSRRTGSIDIIDISICLATRYVLYVCDKNMMTSLNGNIIRVTGSLLGNWSVTGYFPPRGASIFPLICAETDNRDAGDSRRQNAYYDITSL